MKQDRFLIGILSGIAVLIVLALIVFFARPNTLQYGEEATPSGVVHNYLVALYLKDYEKAYTYLADLDHKPSLAEFREPLLLNYINPSSAGAEILETEITGQDAVVNLSVLYSPNDPFSGNYRSPEPALLFLQNGTWKVRQMPYSFWYYDWYQIPAEDSKP